MEPLKGRPRQEAQSATFGRHLKPFAGLTLKVLLVIFLQQHQVALTEATVPSLNGAAFEVKSSVSVVVGEHIQSTIRFEERYSASQKRAVIEVDSERKAHTSGTYFVVSSEENRSFVLQKPWSREREELRNNDGNIHRAQSDLPSLDADECRKLTVAQLRSQFEMDFLNEVSTEEVAPDYLAGPARLLALVAAHRDKLKWVGLSWWRNLKCNIYWLTLTRRSGNNFNITVRFDAHNDPRKAGAYPLALDWPNALASDQHHIIRFSRMRFLRPMDAIAASRNRQFSTGLVGLGSFVVALNGGCASSMSERSVDLFSDKFEKSVKFSFRAHVWHLPAAKGRRAHEFTASVAYDANLRSLRVDTTKSAPVVAGDSLEAEDNVQSKLSSDSTTTTTTTLFNFATRRWFHHNHQAQDSEKSVFKSSGGGVSCVTCLLPTLRKEDLELGALLIGESNFVYMGRARVRGISALVYEADDSKYPFWLEPPILQRDAKTQAASLRGSSDADDTHTTIAYFASSQSSNHSLLLVEIYRRKRGAPRESSHKTVVTVHDFVWSLNEAPSGERATELFSLHDRCAASNDEDENQLPGQASLVLEHMDLPTGSNDKPEWLRRVATRNQAVLGGLQQRLELPATMVYDLESRYEAAPRGGVNVSSSSSTGRLIVSFKLARHSGTTPTLTWLDRGKVSDRGKLVQPLGEFGSFLDCYMAAAHSGEDHYLSYNKDDNQCLLSNRPIDQQADDSALDLHGWQLSLEGPVDVYRIKQQRVYTNAFCPWMYSSSFDYNYRYNWLQKSVTLIHGTCNQEMHANFIIKQVHVREQGPREISLHQNKDKTDRVTPDMPSGVPLKIHGFALDENNRKINQLVEPAELVPFINDKSPSGDAVNKQHVQMSPKLCHAKCHSTPDCRSYSVCFANFQYSCIISKLDLHQPQVLEQVVAGLKSARKQQERRLIIKAQLVSDAKKTNEIFDVSLVKKLGCSIHTRVALEYFELQEERTSVMLDWGFQVVPTGAGAEFCASLCLDDNLQMLHSNANLSDRSYGTFTNGVKEDTNAIEKLSQSIQELRDETLLQFCPSFKYFDAREVENFKPEKRNKFLGLISKGANETTNKDTTIIGYCIMHSKQRIFHVKQNDEKVTWFDPVRYDFKSSLFYEETHGVGLRGSPVNEIETEALASYRRNNGPLKVAELELLQARLMRGDNSITTIQSGKELCATMCLAQTLNPWPVCKSFDLRLERVKDQHVLMCQMNSITLAQALADGRQDLILDNKLEDGTSSSSEVSEQIVVWHYEPMPNLLLDKAIADIDLELSRDLLEAIRLGYSGSSTLMTFGIILVVLFSLFTGFLLANIVYAQIYIAMNTTSDEHVSRNQHQDDRETIICDRVFDNTANELELINDERVRSN